MLCEMCLRILAVLFEIPVCVFGVPEKSAGRDELGGYG